ncbi:hypothetical protein BC941DRAFT_411949, partial [Chlamydoabsidia padenii]
MEVRKSKNTIVYTDIVEFKFSDLKNNLKAILEELWVFGKANNLEAFIYGPGNVIGNDTSLC